MIYIIGMGNDTKDLTLSAVDTLKKVDKIFIKTLKTPTYKYFKENNIEVQSFDEVFKSASDFNDLDEKIINVLLNDKSSKIAFCVNGNGYEDSTAMKLLNYDNVKVVYGVSKAMLAMTACPSFSYQIFSAYELTNLDINQINLNIPLIVYEIDNKYIARDLKLKLSDIYGEEIEISVYHNDIKTMKLYELDRILRYDYRTSLIITAKTFLDRERYNFDDLVTIIRKLRSPNGCHWDREQTHSTIRHSAIEEAYELMEAVDLDDIDKMQEESGDVTLQGVFHGIIGEDNGEFTVNDMISALCNKLITRHTHIFGNNQANTPAEALMFWEKAKGKEKNQKTFRDRIDAVPKTFGAIMRTEKVISIVKSSKWDFANYEDAMEKVYEELEEFKTAENDDEREKEAGDVFLSFLNAIRFKGIKGEIALTRSVEKFINRFLYAEDCAIKNGKTIMDMSMNEIEEFYIEAKKTYR